MASESLCIGELIDEFLSYLESVRGLSDNTVVAYGEDLKHFLEVVPYDASVQNITLEDLKECVGCLSVKNYKGTSINRFIAAVRTFFAYCKKFHYINENVSLELKTVKVSNVLPKYMTSNEIDDICAFPDKKGLLWAKRDKAIFEMLYSSGCRVSELAAICFEDMASGYKGAIVKGKGSKERHVFFGQDAVNAFNEYLVERYERFPDSRKGESGYVSRIFLNQKGEPLSSQGIWYIVTKYSGVAGLNKRVTPHAFRHTFATQMLEAGADIRMVQEMLGHSSISTTQRYTHVTTKRLKEVYNQAFPHSGKED